MESPFILLQPGQRERDEAWAGGDLMEYFHLLRLYKFSQTNLVPTNYLKGVPGDTTLWRGNGTDIAPLADLYPSAQRPTFEALPLAKLKGDLRLEAGKFQLAEVDKGMPVTMVSFRGDEDTKVGNKKKDKQGQKRKQDAR